MCLRDSELARFCSDLGDTEPVYRITLVSALPVVRKTVVQSWNRKTPTIPRQALVFLGAPSFSKAVCQLRLRSQVERIGFVDQSRDECREAIFSS